jgi:hypothetical protein
VSAHDVAYEVQEPTCRQSLGLRRRLQTAVCFNLALLIGPSASAPGLLLTIVSCGCSRTRPRQSATRCADREVTAPGGPCCACAHPVGSADGTSDRRDRGEHAFAHARSSPNMTFAAGTIPRSPHPRGSAKCRPPDDRTRVDSLTFAASICCRGLCVAALAGALHYAQASAAGARPRCIGLVTEAAPNRTSEPSAYMRGTITASLRANATTARWLPREVTQFGGQVVRPHHICERTNGPLAVSSMHYVRRCHRISRWQSYTMVSRDSMRLDVKPKCAPTVFDLQNWLGLSIPAR